MNNITFIIHLRRDTDERAKNVEIVISYYQSIFPDSQFIIVEDDKVQNFVYLQENKNTQYIYFYNNDQHNKCKGYNIGLANCKTNITCFLDIDCIISKQNIDKVLHTLNHEKCICIGYNGVAVYFSYLIKNKINCVDESLYDFLEDYVDVSNIHIGYENDLYAIASTRAVGGALFGHTQTFNTIGGFNPNFRGWGYEDNEIIVRAKKLDIPIYQINTSKPFLFHLPHISENNKRKEFIHPHFNDNEREFQYVKSLSKEEIKHYVKLWK